MPNAENNATTAAAATLAAASDLIEWYWQYGIQRNERYALSSTWLDQLYDLRSRAAAVVDAQQKNKPCMAIWGPSQTGKSTLISSYVDGNGEGDTALQWDSSEPVRFDRLTDNRGKIVLNPYNQGSDASGCASRFVLRDSVPDPKHPVEIRLATEAQLLHALAVGYLSECDLKDNDGRVVKLDPATFRARLQSFRTQAQSQRGAYEFLHEVANVLELLIGSQIDRYENLNAEWRQSLRRELLECNGLLASKEAVENLAAELFWDNRQSLTGAYREIIAKLREVRDLLGKRRLFCSYHAAALFLNIASYTSLLQSSETTRDLRESLHSLCLHDTPDALLIGQGNSRPNATQLCSKPADFALWQGCVWELVIPLYRARLDTNGPVLAKFLESADILDFPGVAQSHGKASETRLAEKQLLNENEKHKLFTEILKRGKTASFVLSSSRNLQIDGFTILNRIGHFPAQPSQLVSGVRAWWQSFGHKWPPHTATNGLSLNLVLTFAGTFVNRVIQSGVGNGLAPLLDQIAQLGHLANPAVVNTFITTYPQFEADGKIKGTSEQIETAKIEIPKDNAFRSVFPTESVQAMIKDGGTDYFFEQLQRQAKESEKPVIIHRLDRENHGFLEKLLEEAHPSDLSAQEVRNRDLEEWLQAILCQMNRDPSEHAEEPPDKDPVEQCSNALREIFNIDPKGLDPLPLDAILKQVQLASFIRKQYKDWCARTELPHASTVGLRDSAHLSQMLGYFVDAADIKSLSQWLRKNFGNLQSPSEARCSRRFLAIRMADELLYGNRTSLAPHRNLSNATNDNWSVKGLLVEFAKREEQAEFSMEFSPHYVGFVYPFLQRLKCLQGIAVAQRPTQPGDDQLTAIRDRYGLDRNNLGQNVPAPMNRA